MQGSSGIRRSSSRLSFQPRNILLPAIVLLAIAALAFGIAPRYANSRSAGATLSQGSNSPLSGLFADVNPSSITFGPNVRANSDSSTYGQHEPSLAVSRVDTNTVIVASKDYRNGNIKKVWIDVSNDGGVTWPANLQLQMPGVDPTNYPLMSDPVVMARDDGRIYVSCLGYNNQNAVFITWTDDNGATWHNPSVQISPADTSLDDKDWFAIDNNPLSPHYHNMYMLYAPGASYVAEQHSTDGGVTWSTRQSIPNGSGREYTYPVIASDGTVYNFMMDNWCGGCTGTIELTKSTNGGVTWSNPTSVTTAYQPTSPIRGGDQFRFFAILSAAIDPNDGSLYVAWTDNRNFATNGTDVMYAKSTDSGATWTQPIRLSHDPTGVVHDHITPMITIDASSRIHAFWLDRRNDINNKLFQSWYSSSTDGGATWDADTLVSTFSQNLDIGLPPGSGGAAGDYWGLDVYSNTVYVAWNDSHTGEQDILVSQGIITSGGGGTPTPIPTSTATNTPIPPNTATAIVTATNTPGIPTITVTATNTPGIPTITVTATNTPGIPTITVTLTPTNTPGIPTITVTPTATATNTPGTTTTAVTSPTPTECAQIFTDVEPLSTFYSYIQTLACRSIVSGYPCGGAGEPCDQQNRPYFRPQNNLTRGQLSKIVVLSAGFAPVTGIETFEDVPEGSTFHPYIEALYVHGIIDGYPCGGVGEPCNPPSNRGYFRPNAPVTRGETAKIVAIASGHTGEVNTQTFEDVQPGSTFFSWVENLAELGVMQGYPCGGAGEPCNPPTNRPYFRPGVDITRAQTSKIATNTFFP
jgi:BNR repeat-like domain/S-layer homology domain